MATKKSESKTKAASKATKASASKAASAKGGTKGAAKTTTKARPSKSTAAKATAAPKKAKGETIKVAERHPRAKLIAQHGSKEALAKSLAASLARPDEDTDILEASLKTASNKQLLRLAKVTATVKEKWGSRDRLIAAIGEASKKAKDKDYIAKLGTYSLPQLLDLAQANQRRARA